MAGVIFGRTCHDSLGVAFLSRSNTEIGYSHICRITDYSWYCSRFPLFAWLCWYAVLIQGTCNLETANITSIHLKHSLNYLNFILKRVSVSCSLQITTKSIRSDGNSIMVMLRCRYTENPPIKLYKIHHATKPTIRSVFSRMIRTILRCAISIAVERKGTAP